MKLKLPAAFSLSRYCRWLRRRYGQILFVSLILSLVGGYYSVKLFANLRTDLEELLPENAPSIRDMKSIMGRVGALNHLSIVVESKDQVASLRFVKDVSARLRELPKDLVARVEDNIIKERDFFMKNRFLYMDLEDWEGIEDYLRTRYRYERSMRNKYSLSPINEKPEFDIDGLKKKYSQRSSSIDRFPDGYFISRDGYSRVVLARLPGKVTDMTSNNRLSEAGHKIVADLNPKSYAPDMVVGFNGDVQNVVEEQRGVVEDLVTSTVACTVLVTLAMLLYFKSFYGAMALTIALFAGTAWTFGLSYFAVGYLNANTAFLGSIVLGNGINFGIIMIARYFEERRRGVSWTHALPRAIGHTSEATWTAAAAAGLSYLSLILTDFRGFNQFGIIGGIGMAMCWGASFTTLPALLIFLERKKLLKIKTVEVKNVLMRSIGRFVEYAYKPIFILTIVSIFVSVFYIRELAKDPIEMDLSKLRSKESLEHGSGFWSKKVDKIFEMYLTPTLVMTTNQSDALKVAEVLRQVVKDEGENTPISDIKTVEDFLPKDQSRKIRIISSVKELLPQKIVAKLSAEDKKLVSELLPERLPEPLTPKDLPDGIQMQFRELDGQIGRFIHVYPKFSKGEFWDGNKVIQFTERIREAISRSGIGAFIAGQAPISADMISAIKEDGPKATLFAFLGVMLLVMILFPSFSHSRSILIALVLGVLWMLALMGAFDLKVNFLNFIALPITFGIGVDYSVNILSRYRSDGGRSIVKAIEHSGGAVALCSFTTVVGYGSLILAGNQAFVSFGVLAVVGEMTCLIAALIALPAAWKFFEPKNKRPDSTSRRISRNDLRSLRQ